jgi:hypothetical protein
MKIPKLCKQKMSGGDRAYVRINGVKVHCGNWKTLEAKEKYQRVIAEWLATSQSPVSGKSKKTPVTVATLPSWMDTTGLGIQYRQYTPLGSWTNVTNPTWSHTINVTNPGWLFVRIYSTTYMTTLIPGPWADRFIRGTLPDGDLFKGEPPEGTPTSSVRVLFGSWYDSLDAATKSLAKYHRQVGQ